VGPTSKDLSSLLESWKQGDRGAIEAIFPVIYQNLRRLARQHLKRQRSDHTLQPTALVHEVYLRLASQGQLAANDRIHILGIAAQLMRWILADYERKRVAAKRGAGCTRVVVEEAIVALNAEQARTVDFLALDEALRRLSKLDAQQCQIVELRYFAGLSIEDTAEYLGISPATVKREWASARAWLLREMSKGDSANGPRAVAAH
jgi:RNA polymerase sigma factor (TIGR02999 family)